MGRSRWAFYELVNVCPFLEVDGRSATLDSFGSRLQQFWLPDEPILYVGKAGTSLSARTSTYYSTKLGATGPHAGGWWLKMLAILPELTVHYARHSDVDAAEIALINQFAHQLSPTSRANLLDRNRVGPFANVRIPGYGNKAHGLDPVWPWPMRAKVVRVMLPLPQGAGWRRKRREPDDLHPESTVCGHKA
ncbi:hypothetical protein ACQCSU_16485 [Pseudarthrobacter sp. O4]|uniref:hypothetical protein n=1 Tax=Pseudarthrobacter sp. O4 TaxID=3418417 RepID=UPI003CF103A0